MQKLIDDAAQLIKDMNKSRPWIQPSSESKYRTQLYLNNSMAGDKVEFIPSSDGRNITWYGCGPTVYDAAHLGHARTYVSFDIVRRVLQDYFGYDINMCMNITDIDDKIIKRSQEQNIEYFTLARHWELLFWKDMLSLNVLLPDVITRVSEYVSEIIEFIEKIIKNGFAYESEGSVYFDVQKFKETPHHIYGRMEPSAVNDVQRVMEGEGALGLVGQKKCILDFALWKKAKPNEPHWASPWGEGRPGWHIECSTMASKIFGFPIDIHSGGVDLKFPHHDNELAQSEACYDRPQWINYFLHSGHLHIKGSKMSKSLKNFITICECLTTASPRVIRLLFLKQRWDAPMNFSVEEDSLAEAKEIDLSFVRFFSHIYTAKRQACDNLTTDKCSGLNAEQKWQMNERKFYEAILSTKSQVDAALRDNIDTPAALQVLRDLLTTSNIYMSNGAYRLPLLLKAANFIFRMCKIFGLTNGNEDTLDYAGLNSHETDAHKKIDTLMDILSSFRSQIRQDSINLSRAMKKTPTEANDLIKKYLTDNLSYCDHLRDQSLLQCGYLVEDSKATSTWRELTKEEKEKHSTDSKTI